MADIREENASVMSILNEQRQKAINIKQRLNGMGFPPSVMKIGSNNGYRIILEVNAAQLLEYLEQKIS